MRLNYDVWVETTFGTFQDCRPINFINDLRLVKYPTICRGFYEILRMYQMVSLTENPQTKHS